MSTETRATIVAAAVTVVGAPTDGATYKWRKSVEGVATDIAAMSAAGDPIGRAVQQLLDSKTLVGIVSDITKEKSSTRGKVELDTGYSTKYSPDGIDTFRTDRTDTDAGLAMAKRIRSLKGHRVRVWIENEGRDEAAGEKGFRVVRRVEDLGEVED
ncbi:hypothetical protein [Aeromicrobium sp. CTD01-1L150]|uniref:hypothetical protein n=1 Tax=Aeromicrobium sp. CTD01-1L150 TaxID=3341830 RepID=UPI0035C218A7